MHAIPIQRQPGRMTNRITAAGIGVSQTLEAMPGSMEIARSRRSIPSYP